MKKNLLLVLVIVFLVPFLALAYVSPGKPSGYVNDFADLISANDKQVLESKLSEFAKTGTVQIAVVTVSTIGDDETIETYATKLFEEWKIGEKGKDNGLLILVALNERQTRIEVGYGLEGAITDLQAKNVIEKVMIPAFKTGDYSSGIKGAVDAVISVISGSPEGEIYSQQGSSRKFEINYELVVFLFFFLISIFSRILSKTKSWWLGGVIGAGIGVIVSLIVGFLYAGLISIIILAILGFIFDYLVSRNGGKNGTNNFWTGGGFGGHSSGGFGGFGGGMSGGGGASGRW